MSPESFKQAQSDSSDTIAMLVEIIFGFFGILGMGWLYAGNLTFAAIAFVGFIILVFIEMMIATATFGFALCLILPFNIIIAVISGLRVRDYVRNSGATGSVVYLAGGIILGSVIICGGGTLFFGGLAGLASLAGG